MKKYTNGVFSKKFILFLVLFGVTVSLTFAEEDEKNFYTDLALIQCNTSTFQALEKVTVSFENTYQIRIMGKLAPHFMLAYIPDDLVGKIRNESVVENVFKAPISDTVRKSIAYKDKDSKFALGYWGFLMENKKKGDQGILDDVQGKQDMPPLLNDDMPGTQLEEDLEYHRQRVKAEYPKLTDAVKDAHQEEINAVIDIMDGFWDAFKKGNVSSALTYFSHEIDSDEMAKIQRSLERDRDDFVREKDKREALKDYNYYLYKKAKVVIFQEQGLPCSEITFVKENSGIWNIIELS